MKRITIGGMKVNIVFREDQLPALDPNDPSFLLVMGSVEIRGRVHAKAARKLAVHKGGVVLQGRLVVEAGNLVLTDAGFSWIDPKPKAETEAAAGGGGS
jgi:hypothetical protein